METTKLMLSYSSCQSTYHTFQEEDEAMDLKDFDILYVFDEENERMAKKIEEKLRDAQLDPFHED